MTRLLLLVPALLMGLLLFTPTGQVPACAPVFHRGARVEIATESAIIVWDAERKTQHFIRRATFRTQTPDFGFLVPTPTKPELAESPDAAFATLEKATAPEVVTQKMPQPRGAWGLSESGASGAAGGQVSVLESKRVGGYDVVVLEAKEPEAMRLWLEKHGYEARPALTGWLKPYIEAGWKITAFKIAKDGKEQPGVATSAVRMSFQTEKPFFPYREPEDQHQKDPAQFYGERLLRVYFLGPQRVEGRLGEQSSPARTVWAGTLKDADHATLVKQLALPGEAPEGWVLTEMEDRSSPRPATADVSYTPSVDQGNVRRPAIVNYVYEEDHSPVGLTTAAVTAVIAMSVLLLAGVVLILFLRWYSRTS